jgi:DNA-binding transcriptional LysR family regulator
MAISLNVVETGSLTAAARVMSTTTPSASKSLADPSPPFAEGPHARL